MGSRRIASPNGRRLRALCGLVGAVSACNPLVTELSAPADVGAGGGASVGAVGAGGAGSSSGVGGGVVVAHCVDGARDADETDVDCGGSACAPCGAGSTCTTTADCAGGPCRLGRCGVVAVGAGEHSCALSFAGGVECWGDNYSGEIGDGSTTLRGEPVPVVGLDHGVVSISVGDEDTCVVTESGGVKCWGSNRYAQLGDGTTTDRSTPVDVVGLPSAAATVSTQAGTTCAVLIDGGVWCWGSNTSLQLGDGSTALTRASPGPVPVSAGATAVSVGDTDVCALLDGGALQCWGQASSTGLPADVAGLSSGVAQVVTGSYVMCALTTLGAVLCWGSNPHGALGDGTLMDHYSPAPVVGLPAGVTALSSGSQDVLAMTPFGQVQGWGWNHLAELGDGTRKVRRTPVAVDGLGGPVTAISMGGDRACAVMTTGGVECWGMNGGGIGDGTHALFARRPTEVKFP